MKITPTAQLGIKITIDSTLDWSRLQLIVIDASKGKDSLGLVLNRNMEMDQDWQDYVLPDLSDGFTHQIHTVNTEIQRARSKNAESGELYITLENSYAWYSTINQARLSLEGEFQLSKISEIDNPTKLERSTQSAYLKNKFYTFLQSQLLTHVLSPNDELE